VCIFWEEFGLISERMTLSELVRYFLYLGAFGFGSGLVIIPFLTARRRAAIRLVERSPIPRRRCRGDDHPGPVVITVAFIGFLVAGLAGAIMAAIGIFLPVYFFTIVPAPCGNE